MFGKLFRSQTVTWACISHDLGPAITIHVQSSPCQRSRFQIRNACLEHAKWTELAAIGTSSAAPVRMEVSQPFPFQPTNDESKPLSMPYFKLPAVRHVKSMSEISLNLGDR